MIFQFRSILEYLVLCSESEEDLKEMLRCFVEVCRRSGLKVNAGKSKVMMLNGEWRNWSVRFV